MLASLTLSWQGPLSYRNQSIDLQSKSSKSMDRLLYDNGLRHERVKTEFFGFGDRGQNISDACFK